MSTSQIRDFREHLLLMYTTALRAVNGQQLVAHYLREHAYAYPSQ